jgi:periplasmic protein TonB
METRALAASALAHAGVLVALFAVFPSAHARMPQTLDVHLLSASSTPAAPAPPAPEKPSAQLQPEKTPNKPTDEVVKIPKTKNNEPSRPKHETSENTTGPAVVGSSGLSAEVGVDDANFEFTYYLIALRNRIGQNWSAPAGVSPGGNPAHAVIYFQIGRDGKVMNAKVEESSGVAFFDQSALRAVLVSDPVPPLPLGYTNPTLGVHFAFEFSGP